MNDFLVVAVYGPKNAGENLKWKFVPNFVFEPKAAWAKFSQSHRSQVFG
ncbi:MAG: hypothetical protein HND44_19615 [Chloroflexi bacterium]|nr:hypothetical protein [Ardenticatenaceae bacterium]NOG36754.1 hypothetical protein [Chloroflexota bacterium]